MGSNNTTCPCVLLQSVFPDATQPLPRPSCERVRGSPLPVEEGGGDQERVRALLLFCSLPFRPPLAIYQKGENLGSGPHALICCLVR